MKQQIVVLKGPVPLGGDHPALRMASGMHNSVKWIALAAQNYSAEQNQNFYLVDLAGNELVVFRLERNSSVLDALIFPENCSAAEMQRVFDQELTVYYDGG